MRVRFAHLMTRSFLQQHVALLVEQEHAEGSMQPYAVVVHLMTVAFARVSNVFIITIDENAIF